MTTEPNPPRPPDENPLAHVLVSLSGVSSPGHDTGPPGADPLSVQAGHEPDRFLVRSVLYVPLVVVVALVLAYLLVTWLFGIAMSNRAAEEAEARRQNPQVVDQIAPPFNDRAGRISSTDPQQLRVPGDPKQVLSNTGVPQPRLEGLKQTEDLPGNDPSFYRSKLPTPEGNNPPELRPEDLRPENYISRSGDPVVGQKILAEYGWADQGKRLARVPIDEYLVLAVKGHKLPVRKGQDGKPAEGPPRTSDGLAKQSNAGRGGPSLHAPAINSPHVPAPEKDKEKAGGH